MTAVAATRPRTYLPPATAQLREVINFAQVLRTSGRYADGQRAAQLIGPDGQTQVVPAEIFEVLEQVANALAQGNGVTVAPNRMVLTTQEAADFLGVSRPTLIKYLEGGLIPFTRVGRHRRVELRDVLAFSEQEKSRSRSALAELTKITQANEKAPVEVDPLPLERLSELDD